MGAGGCLSGPARRLGVGWLAHVLPVEDAREHETSFDCWCGPRVEEGMVIHNADDGREKFESGERVPS